jgi:hypothetical protein
MVQVCGSEGIGKWPERCTMYVYWTRWRVVLENSDFEHNLQLSVQYIAIAELAEGFGKYSPSCAGGRALRAL